MAVAQNLSVLAYANRFTLWHYRTVEKDIEKDGYFNNMDDLLRVQDVLIICTDIAGAAQTAFYTVCSNERGVVRVRPVALPMSGMSAVSVMTPEFSDALGAVKASKAMEAAALDGAGLPVTRPEQGKILGRSKILGQGKILEQKKCGGAEDLEEVEPVFDA